MSHFAQIKSSIKSVDALVAALTACGVPKEQIEIHQEAQPLIDYVGKRTHYCFKDTQDERFKDCDKAHVIVRRKTLNGKGGMHNDLGFYIDGDKSVSFICEYTRGSSSPVFKTEDGGAVEGDAWLKAVKHAYQYQVMKLQYPFQEIEREFIQTDKGQRQRLIVREV